MFRSLALTTVMVVGLGAVQATGQTSFIGNFNTIVVGPSTVPSNGDLNPYGVAQVPVTTGLLTKGNFLVSNFNNSSNQQGTGTTIVQITPGKKGTGTAKLFAEISATLEGCPGGVGLTTALVALQSGYVIVGSLPSNMGNPLTVEAGCLIVLNSYGNVVKTFHGHGINGPWDMTAADGGELVALFVTNVLNGTVAGTSVDVGDKPPTPLAVVNRGTVLRLYLEIIHGYEPFLIESTVIGSRFPERLDPAALVIGPTGVAYDPVWDVLYVADTLNNRIAAIDFALFRFESDRTGRTLTRDGSLNSPLGLALAPNGHVLSTNGGDGYIVETTRRGEQIAKKLVDSSGSPAGAGALFGLIAVPGGVYFVDDATNNFDFLY
jgi:hypothetical protein